MPAETNPFAAPQSHDDAPVPSPPRGFNTAGLRTVRNGLATVYGSICAAILSFIAIAGLGIAGGQGALVAAFVVVGLLLILSLLGYLIGIGMCIAAPAESRARPMAIAALVLPIAGFFANITAMVAAGDQEASLVLWTQQVSNWLATASVVCFILCMRRVAKHIGRGDMIARSTRVMVTLLIASVLTFGGVLVAELTGNPTLAGIGVIGVLVGLIGLLMYANLATYLRKAVGEALTAERG